MRAQPGEAEFGSHRGPEVAVKVIRDPEYFEYVARAEEKATRASTTSVDALRPPLPVQLMQAAAATASLLDLPQVPIIPLVSWHAMPETECFATVTPFIHARGVDCDSMADVAHYISAVLTALSILHDAGIIYRDVKPDNVVIDADTSAVYLIDFDISTFYNTRHGHYSCIGTHGYMAPEVEAMDTVHDDDEDDESFFSRVRGYTLAADMYSVGVMLGECLFSDTLDDFGVRSNPATIEALLAAAAADPNAFGGSKVRLAAADLARQLLAPVSADRPSAAAALTHAFFKLA
ncbi:serine/threonine protein kinase [Thecamonas trahens ATCC 50062]|uniref:Serine/threonine protein kinase n=1 Tax=Thecamonas trahens ATCC 50062 TaxID=461836 RepID=A0A0L0DEQ1_THETB|nr:serine/threonine protein kinase [Thecamonas trahens ATCC 50062]KNC50616.1 serine/threonine protein kinase [Thecamonas trahens ATCC 50062]|eukprot:XP_013762503.1 serine/threonine protein kinase [Thecamonas trahens ATCC 50062]